MQANKSPYTSGHLLNSVPGSAIEEVELKSKHGDTKACASGEGILSKREAWCTFSSKLIMLKTREIQYRKDVSYRGKQIS